MKLCFIGTTGICTTQFYITNTILKYNKLRNTKTNIDKTSLKNTFNKFIYNLCILLFFRGMQIYRYVSDRVRNGIRSKFEFESAE